MRGVPGTRVLEGGAGRRLVLGEGGGRWASCLGIVRREGAWLQGRRSLGMEEG